MSRKKDKHKKSLQVDILLLLFAAFLTLIFILILIKNSLISNIIYEDDEDYEILEYNQISKNVLVEAELDKSENENIQIIPDETFLIKPPEIEKIEEELKVQQREKIMNKKTINLYFIKVTSDGHLTEQSIKRAIYYEKNILEETLKALIKGPNEFELKNNFLSLIPINTKILSLSVDEHTAKIDLSREFYDNAFGIDGTINKIKQIVLTVLSINNIKNIILTIEGNPIIIEELGLDFSEALSASNISNY